MKHCAILLINILKSRYVRGGTNLFRQYGLEEDQKCEMMCYML